MKEIFVYYRRIVVHVSCKIDNIFVYEFNSEIKVINYMRYMRYMSTFISKTSIFCKLKLRTLYNMLKYQLYNFELNTERH
jgi:hypothetical protein